MIPKQIIEEIKYRNDIHMVISERVTLKKAGSVYLGLCPFHSEKTPSFTVFPKTASYFCFGCQAGGDVISFTMATENLTYVEALKSLADRSGIVIPEDEKEKYVSSGPSKDRILSLNKDAARFFVAELKKSREAQEYVKSRNLSPSLITHFGIGYAPNSFYALTDHLKSKGYSYEGMEAAFLSKKSERSDKYFDLFRNRIIFPVIDTTGNVIAFGGRNITNEKPKYINTSDTPVFSKRRNVFALNFAKAHCAEKRILCEGYMDGVSLHGAGFPNSIATCGTAITPDQARLMGRYTKTVIISYDSDEAGQNAAEKAFNVLGEAGVEAKLLNMHGAKDPDEYIKKFGALSFRNLIDGSSSYFDFRLDDALSKYDVSTPDGKMKASSAILQTIIKVQSEVEREIYINRAAEKIGINADGLKYDVKRAVGKAANAAKREETEQIIRQTEGYGDRI
ncbi:MAG: DNA primase, partial [Firmicutes bacterium]|nr:DNA primase [Candidatus Colimorpha enterica]